MKYLVTVAFMFAHFAASVLAADWPQYLGPDRNSISQEKGLLRSWPEHGPEVLWTVSVGKGYGGPVVKDGKVYLLDRADEVGDNLRCFDLSSGKELWNFAYDAPGEVSFPGSRSVPTVDGNHVYSCGHNGDLYCMDIDTHKPIWNKNVWTDFGGALGGGCPRGAGTAGRFPIWAITQCPLVYEDLLIVASQAPDAGVVAYDKLTGEVKWKTPSLGYVGYVSPAIAEIDGEDHVVMITPSTNPFRRTRYWRAFTVSCAIAPSRIQGRTALELHVISMSLTCRFEPFFCGFSKTWGAGAVASFPEPCISSIL